MPTRGGGYLFILLVFIEHLLCTIQKSKFPDASQGPALKAGLCLKPVVQILFWGRWGGKAMGLEQRGQAEAMPWGPSRPGWT